MKNEKSEKKAELKIELRDKIDKNSNSMNIGQYMAKFTTGTAITAIQLVNNENTVKYGKIRQKSHKIGQKHQKPHGNSRHFAIYHCLPSQNRTMRTAAVQPSHIK